MERELELLLSSPPPFPGVRLHVITEAENNFPLDKIQNSIEKTSISFPVNIHTIDKQNSRIISYDESAFAQSKLIKNRAPTIRELKESKDEIEMVEVFEEEHDMIPIPISGCVSIQGERSHMEDRFTLFEKFHKEFSELNNRAKQVSYFGVYDGHAGARVSDFCTEQLHKIIALELSNIENDSNIVDSLAHSLLTADEEIMKLSQGTWKDGSCVSVIMMFDSILYSVNLGDSHMVLCEKRSNSIKPFVLSRPHIASNDDEKKRIISLGGMIAKGRIFGDLMVSRALGDLDFKRPKQEEDYVSNIPHKERVILNSRIHPFFIIASDGLWDKLTYQEAVNIVDKCISENQKDPYVLSKILVDEVLKRGGLDNTTALVVLLNWVQKESYVEESKCHSNHNLHNVLNYTIRDHSDLANSNSNSINSNINANNDTIDEEKSKHEIEITSDDERNNIIDRDNRDIEQEVRVDDDDDEEEHDDYNIDSDHDL